MILLAAQLCTKKEVNPFLCSMALQNKEEGKFQTQGSVRRKMQKVLFQVTSDLCTVCNANHHSQLCPSAEENEKKGKNNPAHPSASTLAAFIYFRSMREREREREGERERKRERERERDR